MYDGRCAGLYEKDIEISYDFDERITDICNIIRDEYLDGPLLGLST